MGQIDEQRERERLAELYAGTEKGELEEIARDADSLNPVAREALRAEMLSRGMEAPPANAGAARDFRAPCPRCGSLDVSIDEKGAAFAELRVGVLVSSRPPDPSKCRTSTLKKRTPHRLRSIRRRGIAETVRVAHASAPLSIPRVCGDANNSASLS